jgi:hypothetical protein
VEGRKTIEDMPGRAKIPVFHSLERAAKAIINTDQYFRVRRGAF